MTWATQKNTRLDCTGWVKKWPEDFLAFAESASASLSPHYVMSEL